MAAPTPTTEPSTLIAGDTAKWLKPLPDYLASAGWVLTYTLVNVTNRITFNATASGADHLVNVAASTTVGWAAGTYAWRAAVALSGEVYTVDSGNITIQPTFGAASDTRSSARKALKAINDYIENPNNLQAAEYTIAGRSLLRHNLSTLMEMRSQLIVEVAQEDAAANLARGLPDKRRVLVRFG